MAEIRPSLIVTLVVGMAGCSAPAVTPNPSPAPASVPATSAPAETTGEPSPTAPTAELSFEVATYPVPAGSHPHDVAPAADGGIWYTGQRNGTLGWLDPETGEVREIALGAGSAPHGVITGPDGAAWVTDGGLNAIVRVDGDTHELTVYTVPGARANLNPPPSMATTSCGSPARTGSTAASTRPAAR